MSLVALAAAWLLSFLQERDLHPMDSRASGKPQPKSRPRVGHGSSPVRITCAATFSLIASLLAQSSFALPEALPRGDVNQDGFIDAADALLLKRHLSDPTAGILNESGLLAADLAPIVAGVSQPDDVVDLGDLLVLFRLLNGSVGTQQPTLASIPPSTENPIPSALTGTGPPNATIHLFARDSTGMVVHIDTVTADASGYYSFANVPKLFDGLNQFFVVAVGASGFASSPSVSQSTSYTNTVSNPPPSTVSDVQVWTSHSAGDYMVNNGITVTSTGTLILGPGAILRFAAGKTLTVGGTLKIFGGLSNAVVLTSTQTTPGAWTGILVMPGGSAVVNRADISFPVTGIKASGGPASAIVRHSTISAFSSKGVWFIAASGDVRNSTFSDPSGVAVAIDLYSPNGVVIAENAIHGTFSGIVVDLASGSSGATIVGNQLFGDDAAGTAITIRRGTSSLVSSNTIRGFTQGLLLSDSSSQVEANEVYEARHGINVYGTGSPTLIGNHIELSNVGIDISGSINGILSPTLIRNRVVNSSVDAVHIIFSDGATLRENEFVQEHAAYIDRGTGVSIFSTDVTVTHDNVFENFAWGIDIVGGRTTIDDNNRFLSNGDAAIYAAGDEFIITGNYFQGNRIGVEMRGESGLVSSNEFVDNVTGVVVYSDSGVIENNLIKGHASQGIYLFGTSAPLITGNTITENAIGIRLVGSVVAFPGINAGDPAPIIQGNDIFANTDGVGPVINLKTEAYGLDKGVVVDARENWWGTSVASQIAATFVQIATPGVDQYDAPHDVVPINYSRFLGGSIDEGGTVVGPDEGLVTTLLTSVLAENITFNPLIGETTRVKFTLAAPASVKVKFVLYSGYATGATPVCEVTGTFNSGTQWLDWNGRGTGTSGCDGPIQVEEAYVYIVEATNGLLSAVYDPSYGCVETPNFACSGATGGITPNQYNVFRNDFLKVNYTLTKRPGRVTARIISEDVPEAFQPFDFFNAPVAVGTRVISWDGRLPNGSILTKGNGLNSANQVHISFLAPISMKRNTVFIVNTPPLIDGGPTVEVKPNPYLVVHSFDQVSRIDYCINQTSQVKVKILKPGATDPTIASQVLETLQDDVATSSWTDARDCDAGQPPVALLWRGHAAGDSNEILTPQDGFYTFTIEARNAHGHEALYRGVIQARQ